MALDGAGEALGGRHQARGSVELRRLSLGPGAR
jgi:hypothetical protein